MKEGFLYYYFFFRLCKICLIPISAHGTNFASASKQYYSNRLIFEYKFSLKVMAGMKIEKIGLDKSGAVDMKHVAELAEKYKDTLACGIVTYPSTSGVFEETIK
jgi:glycine dehydrogenase